MEVVVASSDPGRISPDWKVILASLIAGKSLDFDLAYAAMADMLLGQTPPAVIAGFLVGLRAKGETVEEMAALASAMVDFSVVVPYTGDLVDTCGTGGDQKHSVNISTMTAIVLAAAGAKVCKHGNRAASSKSGSADVLEYLGVRIDLGPSAVLECIDQVGMGFCLAPRYHSAMAHVGGVRRQLAIPTAFNFLGPLVNPARANRQLVGVFDPKMARTMAEVLARLGSEHVLVAYSADGFDELSITAINTVIEMRKTPFGTATFDQYQLDPRDFGFEMADPDTLRGGDASTNGEILESVLAGQSGPIADIVAFNTGAGLYVAGKVTDIATGIEVAKEVLSSGIAITTLKQLVEVSNRQ